MYAANAGELQHDMLQAKDALGHVLDFHSLHHICGVRLTMRWGVSKTIQKVMRHSSISLTLATYGHLMPDAERDVDSHFSDIMARMM